MALSVQQAACQSLSRSKPSSSPQRMELKELCFPSYLQALHQLPPFHTDMQEGAHWKALFPKSMQLVWNLINKKLSISGEKRIWQSSPGIPRQLQRIPGRRNYLEGKLCILLFSPAASMALPTQVIPCPSLCSSCLLQMARVVLCVGHRGCDFPFMHFSFSSLLLSCILWDHFSQSSVFREDSLSLHFISVLMFLLRSQSEHVQDWTACTSPPKFSHLSSSRPGCQLHLSHSGYCSCTYCPNVSQTSSPVH